MFMRLLEIAKIIGFSYGPGSNSSYPGKAICIRLADKTYLDGNVTLKGTWANR